jgi:hypothetical protein
MLMDCSYQHPLRFGASRLGEGPCQRK